MTFSTFICLQPLQVKHATFKKKLRQTVTSSNTIYFISEFKKTPPTKLVGFEVFWLSDLNDMFFKEGVYFSWSIYKGEYVRMNQWIYYLEITKMIIISIAGHQKKRMSHSYTYCQYELAFHEALLLSVKYKRHMSRGMRFPTMWHFDKCRLIKPVQPPLKLSNSKWCSVSSLTIIEYSSD